MKKERIGMGAYLPLYKKSSVVITLDPKLELSHKNEIILGKSGMGRSCHFTKMEGDGEGNEVKKKGKE